jgi:hippurate hydrolase
MAKADKEPLPSLHSAFYFPDAEPSIRTGVRAMSAAVVGLLPAGK